MPLNKQSGNMYGFITHTWNPIRGRCPRKPPCGYCYMKKFPMSKAWEKPLRLVREELRTKLGEGKYIFVGSSSDMWLGRRGDILDVLSKCKKAPSNKYLFQTKSPDIFNTFCLESFPPSHRLATTIESNRDYIECQAPPVNDRGEELRLLRLDGREVMVAVEPVMDFDPDDFLALLVGIMPDLVTFGADSGGHDLPEPGPEKLRDLIDRLEDYNIPTFLKKNLRRLLPQ